ncbi:unnamed protein product [Amoebophrya sp. A25]|nr:unnamed protein product [Amoebophrya sp. A25]|eukprot:GSA25T00017116001.1
MDLLNVEEAEHHMAYPWNVHDLPFHPDEAKTLYPWDYALPYERIYEASQKELAMLAAAELEVGGRDHEEQGGVPHEREAKKLPPRWKPESEQLHVPGETEDTVLEFGSDEEKGHLPATKGLVTRTHKERTRDVYTLTDDHLRNAVCEKTALQYHCEKVNELCFKIMYDVEWDAYEALYLQDGHLKLTPSSFVRELHRWTSGKGRCDLGPSGEEEKPLSFEEEYEAASVGRSRLARHRAFRAAAREGEDDESEDNEEVERQTEEGHEQEDDSKHRLDADLGPIGEFFAQHDILRTKEISFTLRVCERLLLRQALHAHGLLQRHGKCEDEEQDEHGQDQAFLDVLEDEKSTSNIMKKSKKNQDQGEDDFELVLEPLFGPGSLASLGLPGADFQPGYWYRRRKRNRDVFLGCEDGDDHAVDHLDGHGDAVSKSKTRDEDQSACLFVEVDLDKEQVRLLSSPAPDGTRTGSAEVDEYSMHMHDPKNSDKITSSSSIPKNMKKFLFRFDLGIFMTGIEESSTSEESERLIARAAASSRNIRITSNSSDSCVTRELIDLLRLSRSLPEVDFPEMNTSAMAHAERSIARIREGNVERLAKLEGSARTQQKIAEELEETKRALERTREDLRTTKSKSASRSTSTSSRCSPVQQNMKQKELPVDNIEASKIEDTAKTEVPPALPLSKEATPTSKTIHGTSSIPGFSPSTALLVEDGGCGMRIFITPPPDAGDALPLLFYPSSNAEREMKLETNEEEERTATGEDRSSKAEGAEQADINYNKETEVLAEDGNNNKSSSTTTTEVLDEDGKPKTTGSSTTTSEQVEEDEGGKRTGRTSAMKNEDIDMPGLVLVPAYIDQAEPKSAETNTSRQIFEMFRCHDLLLLQQSVEGFLMEAREYRKRYQQKLFAILETEDKAAFTMLSTANSSYAKKTQQTSSTHQEIIGKTSIEQDVQQEQEMTTQQNINRGERPQEKQASAPKSPASETSIWLDRARERFPLMLYRKNGHVEQESQFLLRPSTRMRAESVLAFKDSPRLLRGSTMPWEK